MKLVLICCVFLFLHSAQSFDMKFLNEMGECAKDMGMSEDELKSLMASNGEKLDCVRACVMKKIGAMTDGKINLTNLMAFIESAKDTLPDYPKMKDALQKCYDEASAGDMTECEAAGKFSLCMHNTLNV